MDYQGQQLCELINQIINIVAGVIGFAYGWWVQSFWVTFLFCVGGFIVSSIACIPDWPFYNRHPLAWQTAEKLPGTTGSDGQPIKDTNTVCGTCACGLTIHGINCESHPDNKDKPVSNTSAPAADAGTEMPKVKGSNKKKASSD